MKYFLPFYLTAGLFSVNITFAQSTLSSSVGWGNGPAVVPVSECLTESMRHQIAAQLEHNVDSLQEVGILPQVYDRNIVSLSWPLQQAAGYSDPGYCGISNYIDQNASNALLDFNCGSRTYDGHKGTDIFSWPFPWAKVDQNAIEVIAGAAGTIIGKYDGNYSYNCSFVGNWNAIYIQHADGSVAWYGHMKAGSLTFKAIGQTVVQGEYLGVVASSGNSTGPHLHLEVYKQLPYNDANLIDPWNGSCNPTAANSWWANQEPYYVSKINKISTHYDLPNMPQCYGTEDPKYSNVFQPNTTVYCYGFLRDQLFGQTVTFTIKLPNGTTYLSWTGTSTTYYSASWWNYFFTLPANPPLGTWTYSFTYQGVTLDHNFTVASILPVDLISWKGESQQEGNLLRWSTTAEKNNRRFIIERSVDGITFQTLDEVAGVANSATFHSYQYWDKSVGQQSFYYRLQQEDYNGIRQTSPLIFINRQAQPNFTIAPNPIKDQLRVQFLLPDYWQEDLYAALVNTDGRVLRSYYLDANAAATNWDCDVQDLPTGIYTLQLRSANLSNVLIKKVVKID